MEQKELIPHLFRTEFSKIVAVLCKWIGFEHIDIAEDIASDTFLSAFENWTYKGVPENPTAWLYTVAKNKAKNHLTRNKLFTNKIIAELKATTPASEEFELDMSEENIKDGQLRMLFAICHPSIPQEAQIGLALRILCGFDIDEIANAFLTNKETINKRLSRAKEKLRAEKVELTYPTGGEMLNRLQTVLTTLYLLFNEGYYSESNDAVVREELCNEAMRLLELLMNNKETDMPMVNALYALMCFHVSRFAARKNSTGEIILYDEQDETLWNTELITKGAFHLNKAAQGNQVSKYHLEASIAYWHTIKTNSKEKWENILHLYNHLLQLSYSPIAALNRTYALAKARGNETAITEAEKLQLNTNHYYYTLLGELYKETDSSKAKQHFEKALSFAKTSADKQIIQKKIDSL
ncbi:MAG: sigma-70 family RNA polymerase sigma factor [Sphingobacteriales bacterium]|nr:sigma-70 family RNA polymerase sigma factor [Sphingobacteriales bacterium]MBI3719765.1 sigma-70 family RNA polymerase sigma factor [Sphingobacteriales bacterium]